MLTVIVGVVPFTVPVTASFCVVAPVLACVILPVMLPAVAEALMRAMIAVEVTVPLVGVNVNEFWKVTPSVETSTPAGAVMVIGALRFVPDTLYI